MRSVIASLLAILFISLPANAGNIEKLLSKQHVNHAAVSVSVKDADTGQKIYSINDRTPRQPASTLKVITSAAALDTLGKDYFFTTKLYKSTNNDLYFKLGADPFLKSGDLKKLIQTAKEKNIINPKTIYIDNSIFDNVEWGEGWQWDDDLNPLMPKISAYNLDDNLVNIEITPRIKGTAPNIIIKPFYPVTIMNLITTGSDGNTIKLVRNNSISPNIINVSGEISKQTVLKIPVNNPQLYFNLRLQEAIQNRKMDYYNPILVGNLPQENIYLVGEISNSIELGLKSSLKNSNNLVAETIFKLAGAKYSDSTGCLENSINMLNNYLRKMEINTDDIKIVDGSGVSKNNIITADFMTSFLIKLYKSDDFEYFEQFLPIPSEGTLKNRMLYFKENMRAKTGTLSDTSAITGFIKTKSGRNFVFDIIIQDAKTSETDKKNIEEQILRQIYMN